MPTHGRGRSAGAQQGAGRDHAALTWNQFEVDALTAVEIDRRTSTRRARFAAVLRRRWSWLVVGITVLALLMPVPWLHHVSPDPLGTAWRLNGRLVVDDEVIDPPGRWSWLAIGRPPLVIELLRNRLFGTDNPPSDLREGSLAHRPALSDPAAAAVGLRAAGREVPMRIAIEVRRPLIDGLPSAARITTVNGEPIVDRRVWEQVAGSWSPETVFDPAESISFTTGSGERFQTTGPGLPYQVVTTIDLAPEGLDARIRFALVDALPLDWVRNLSLGNSHGMMVALLTYTHASGRDLAQGRHIAGTGGILGDGTVTRIGGLASKARAAKRAGADVLLVPAGQVGQLEGEDLAGVEVVPVSTLRDAITWLARPVA